MPQLSYLGAHAHNWVAERKHHRYLLEMAPALLIGSFVPPYFWADVISNTVYLINLQPSSLLLGRSPVECLYGSPPRYDHLQVFGCQCFVLLPSRERTKLLLSPLPVCSLDIALSTKAIVAMIKLWGVYVSLVMSFFTSSLLFMYRPHPLSPHLLLSLFLFYVLLLVLRILLLLRTPYPRLLPLSLCLLCLHQLSLCSHPTQSL